MTISGPEMLQNSGKEQMIDLLATRVEIAESRLRNKIDYDLHGDGTANAGKALVGLSAMISTTPSTGTYGGINAANWAFWQNTATTGTTITASNIQAKMTSTALQLVRGTDKADLIVADTNFYSLYVQSLQAIQRITSEESGSAGFASMKFYGGGTSADVVLGGGYGNEQPSNTMYFLNTNYIFLRPHKERNFVPIGGERQAINQDAIVKLYGWAGNLTTSNRFLQGILTN